MDITKTESGLFAVTVDGATYEFEKWGAEEQVDTLLDIAGIVGKPLGMAIGALMGKDGKPSLDTDIPTDLIGLVFESLTQGLKDKALVKSLLRKFASERILCQGVKFNYNVHYQDRLDHLLRVVRAGLEVQYGNFFGALLAIMPKPRGAVPKAEPSKT